MIAQPAAAQDIVLHPADVTTVSGNWARVDSTSGAGGQKMQSADYGWAATNAPLASPGNYFEATFTAQAGINYRVWLRLRAAGNSKWNDAVWVQFSDSLVSGGNALYRIGTANGLMFNLEECTGCGTSGWGWSAGAWWLSQQTVIQFATGGTKTVRVQTREDGVDVDQIVLSPSTYMNGAPGRSRDDATILTRSAGALNPAPPPPAPVPPPPPGGAKPVPGTIQAEDFDTGANGTAYWDSSAGNAGAQYRTTDVDIEGCTEGGHNVGWISAGEWLNYTVNVATAGTYTIEFRVASPYGATLHVNFNGVNRTGAVAVPVTGGWQTWTTVRANATLAAGTQVMRVVFDTGNFNLQAMVLSGQSAAPPPTPAPPPDGAFGGTAWALPGTVQAEDFDNGGNGVSYYDNSSGNAGGAYRPTTDVDIEATPTGGYAIGWAYAGEWLRYTVNVTAAGNYRLVARVASAGSGGTFHVSWNGVNRTGEMRVPNTGSWTAYQDVAATVWLDAGVQTMRLVMDTNGSTSATGNISYIRVESAAAAPPPPPVTGGRFRIATWNIHFGHGNVWGQAQEIVNTGADVVMLQEASTYDEDMRVTYPSRLQQLTGQTWYSAWAGSTTCNSGCQGMLIMSRLPIVASSTAVLAGTTYARALINVGGVNVNVFNVHLEYYDTNKRTQQLLEYMNWARAFSGPRIVGGDFNSWHDEWWIRQMETEYTDTWQDVTGGDGNGYTLNGAVRFDYLFRAHDSSWRLTPTACWVHWTNLSDHMPVVANFEVR